MHAALVKADTFKVLKKWPTWKCVKFAIDNFGGEDSPDVQGTFTAPAVGIERIETQNIRPEPFLQPCDFLIFSRASQTHVIVLTSEG